MEIQLNYETQTKLLQLAASQGIKPEQLAQEAVTAWIQEQEELETLLLEGLESPSLPLNESFWLELDTTLRSIAEKPAPQTK